MIAWLEASLYESLTWTVYWYSFIKSEFKKTPTFLVTTQLELIWNGLSCGSVNWEVPQYEPLDTFTLSNSNLYKVKLANVIVST